MEAGIYHERQHLQHCLRHAINNLAQRPAATASELDAIADGLAPGALPLPFLHPHRTAVLGNWDVSVLECSMARLDLQLRWHDERDATFSLVDFAGCGGVVVNVKSKGVWARITGGRHWFSLRRLGQEPGMWFNLDSRLEAPQRVAASESAAEQERMLRKLLARLVTEEDAKVFIVFKPH